MVIATKPARSDTTTGRRRFLSGVGAACAGAALATRLPLARLFAQAATEHRVVVCYLGGGWDVLLGPDPRDPSRTYEKVTLGVERLAAEDRAPFEARVGATTALLGPTMTALRPHLDKLTVFRGVNMNTVAHEAGRAYVQTWKRPAGSAPRGDSLGTVAAASGSLGDDGPALPHVSIGLESYNESMPEAATAIGLARPEEIEVVVGGPRDALDARVEALLAAAQNDATSCIGQRYEGVPVDTYHDIARKRLERLRVANEVSAFRFNDARETGLDAARALYGIGPGIATGPAYRAAVAATLLKRGLSRAVSMTLENGFDTHFASWSTDQPARQRRAFTALAALLTDLRTSFDPDLTKTTVVVVSEFARTPNLNASGGRDHWFANSFLVFGASLRAGVVGATGEHDLGLLAVDLASGRPDPAGEVVTPEHIASTLAASVGLDPRPYRTTPVDAWMTRSA